MAPRRLSDVLITAVVLTCVLNIIPGTLSFTANLSYQSSHTSRSSSMMSRKYMVPLSNEEIFARAAQQKAQAELEAAPIQPSLYDDEMLQRMQNVLILFDQRAVQGPQSILPEDVEQLDIHLQYILEEMRRNQHLKPQRPSPSSSSSSSPSISAATVSPPSTIQSSTSSPLSTPATNAFQGYSDGDDGGEIIDDNTTTNTYIIPNMEQMTPAEYQSELQRTVIEHQTMRRKTGVTGNRASWNYMNALNPNDTGAMKKEMYE